MPLTFVTGDPFLTRAHALCFGINGAGRAETSPFHVMLNHRFPAAVASFSRQCKNGKIRPGMIWLWRENTPALGFVVVRETPFGASRLRYIESAAMMLARDYRAENLRSAALCALGTPDEWDEQRKVIIRWLEKSALPVTVYETFEAGIAAET